MKKIFTQLCAMLFVVQFASAQQTLYVFSKSGDLAAYPANKVTFDSDLFTFTYGEVTEVTKEKFSASFSVAFASDEYKSLKQTIEVGVCFSDENETPTISDGKIKINSYLGEHNFSINILDAGTTYYYRAYVKVNNVVYYGEVQNVTTFGKKTDYKIIDGHKFVDLGLPSGLLWATCNIGAVTAADDGDYFAWGETSPQTSNYYSWSSYKYGFALSKYNKTDGKKVLDSEDDAAYVNWGASCRMPTQDDFVELHNSENCIWTWISLNNSSDSSIEGYKVTSTKTGNSIFLPASGYRCNEGSYVSNGSYWSSTCSSNCSSAYCINFYRGNFYVTGSFDNYRFCGRNIRPTAEP